MGFEMPQADRDRLRQQVEALLDEALMARAEAALWQDGDFGDVRRAVTVPAIGGQILAYRKVLALMDKRRMD
jgi:hypothetical protein